LKKYLFSALVFACVGAIVWLWLKPAPPPLVAFQQARRENLESSITTNGRVEPLSWAVARAEADGLVERMLVTVGQSVRAGDALVQLTSGELRAERTAAVARLEEAAAALALLESGGRVTERTELDAALSQAKLERSSLEREIATVERLVAKNAAPAQELRSLKEKLDSVQDRINSTTARKAGLIQPEDVNAARARRQAAVAAVASIDSRLRTLVVRAPVAGTVYEVEAKPGAWFARGSAAAKIGQLEEVKVFVYVDEPELGRVQPNMPVSITWDARNAQEWKGTVDELPRQVVAMGTRQVGEVICRIANPSRELLPGTNINARILSERVSNALTIGKECLRRENGQAGVFLLQNDRIVWRPVRTGPASITRAVILEGLSAGDRVAMPVDTALKSGMTVQAQQAEALP
jgi:HlyD family secretion protein